MVELIVNEHIKKNPQQWVSRLPYNDEFIWLKRRPPSKKTMWHRLLFALTYLIPIPIFYPTVAEDDLLAEASRLDLFARKGIAVPEVLLVTANYLVTKDSGQDLKSYLENIPPVQQQHVLEQAIQALLHLHQQGLCHGRPFLRDMTINNNQIYFLDLEEDPLKVMNLAQAQARDLWLFLNSAARHCQHEPTMLKHLFTLYSQHASAELLHALKQMVTLLKPIRWFSEHILGFIKSRDLRCAIRANKAIEQTIGG